MENLRGVRNRQVILVLEVDQVAVLEAAEVVLTQFHLAHRVQLRARLR